MLRKNKKRARMANCSIERQKATDESVEVSDYLVRDDALRVSKRKKKMQSEIRYQDSDGSIWSIQLSVQEREVLKQIRRK